MQKSATTIISSTTILAGETTLLSSCTAIDLSRGTQLVLTAKGTFNAASTSGMNILLSSSIDDSSYDTIYWDTYDIQNVRQLGYTSGDEGWEYGELVTAAAGGTSTILGYTISSGAFATGDAAGDLYLGSITGTFTSTQSLTGGSSGCSAIQNGSIAAHSVIVTLYPIAVVPLYIRAQMHNKDYGYSITGASLTSIKQSI